MLADDGLAGEDLAMKLGLALRRRPARFEGLPDEVTEAIGSRLGLPAVSIPADVLSCPAAPRAAWGF
jgi:hypothetical protein